jgi:hypothetical protein
LWMRSSTNRCLFRIDTVSQQGYAAAEAVKRAAPCGSCVIFASAHWQVSVSTAAQSVGCGHGKRRRARRISGSACFAGSPLAGYRCRRRALGTSVHVLPDRSGAA